MDFGTAVILCGGKSKRMGFDKCNIKINHKYLIEIIGEKLEEIFQEIILVSNDVNKFKQIKYAVVEDILPEIGPLGAIYTALKKCSSKYIFVIPCDMPVINLDYIRYMMSFIDQEKVEGVATYRLNFIEPLYAFYSKDMLHIFEKYIENQNYKLQELISSCKVHYVDEGKVKEYSKDMDMFINLNYAKDLAVLEKIFTEEGE